MYSLTRNRFKKYWCHLHIKTQNRLSPPFPQTAHPSPSTYLFDSTAVLFPPPPGSHLRHFCLSSSPRNKSRSRVIEWATYLRGPNVAADGDTQPGGPRDCRPYRGVASRPEAPVRKNDRKEHGDGTAARGGRLLVGGWGAGLTCPRALRCAGERARGRDGLKWGDRSRDVCWNRVEAFKIKTASNLIHTLGKFYYYYNWEVVT